MSKGFTNRRQVFLRGGLVVLLTTIGVTVLTIAGGDADAVASCPAGPVVTGGAGPAMQVVDGEIHLATPTATEPDAVLELSTTAVHRGATLADLAILDTAAPDRDTIVTTRKDTVETAQRIAAGVEQSWCFRQAPSGSGDLVVRVSAYVAAGKRGGVVQTYPSLDAASGNHPDGVPLIYPGVHALYRHGTWIDSTGRQSPVTARYVDSGVELTVPASLLAETTFPATLDPRIVVTPL